MKACDYCDKEFEEEYLESYYEDDVCPDCLELAMEEDGMEDDRDE